MTSSRLQATRNAKQRTPSARQEPLSHPRRAPLRAAAARLNASARLSERSSPRLPPQFGISIHAAQARATSSAAIPKHPQVARAPHHHSQHFKTLARPPLQVAAAAASGPSKVLLLNLARSSHSEKASLLHPCNTASHACQPRRKNSSSTFRRLLPPPHPLPSSLSSPTPPLIPPVSVSTVSLSSFDVANEMN